MIGGFGWWVDSVILIWSIIGTTTFKQKNECYFSISNSMFVHYIGYSTLIFRAKRIFKVIELE